MVDLPAGAQPQIPRLQRDKAAFGAGLQFVLADELRVKQALVQIRLCGERRPLPAAVEIAAAVRKGDCQHLHGKTAGTRIRQAHGFLRAENRVAPGTEIVVQMLLPTELHPDVVLPNDEHANGTDGFV